MAKCKFCESEEHYKNGIVRGHQRYKCKDCGRNFTQTAIKGRLLQRQAEGFNALCK